VTAPCATIILGPADPACIRPTNRYAPRGGALYTTMTQFVSDTAAPPDDRRPVQMGFRALTLVSIGVVYGDIGTSPL